jgi:hypothetical protein
MKLIVGISLMLGFSMLAEGILLGVMSALLFAFAVSLALPVFYWAFLARDISAIEVATSVVPAIARSSQRSFSPYLCSAA